MSELSWSVMIPLIGSLLQTRWGPCAGDYAFLDPRPKGIAFMNNPYLTQHRHLHLYLLASFNIPGSIYFVPYRALAIYLLIDLPVSAPISVYIPNSNVLSVSRDLSNWFYLSCSQDMWISFFRSWSLYKYQYSCLKTSLFSIFANIARSGWQGSGVYCAGHQYLTIPFLLV